MKSCVRSVVRNSFLRTVEDLPFEVCENVTGAKALRLIEKADCGDCLRFVKEL